MMNVCIALSHLSFHYQVLEKGKEFKNSINPTDNYVSRRAHKPVDDDLYKIPIEKKGDNEEIEIRT